MGAAPSLKVPPLALLGGGGGGYEAAPKVKVPPPFGADVFDAAPKVKPGRPPLPGADVLDSAAPKVKCGALGVLAMRYGVVAGQTCVPARPAL